MSARIPGFVEYRTADMIFGLAEPRDGWTAINDEYPHYALYLDGDNFDLMLRWLKLFGVPNYPYRRDQTALMYFRDPSGNLLEMYCKNAADAPGFARGRKLGGSYSVDFAAPLSVERLARTGKSTRVACRSRRRGCYFAASYVYLFPSCTAYRDRQFVRAAGRFAERNTGG